VLVLASGLVLTSMAIEFAAGNVQVNAMLPGWFETEMTAPVKTMPAIHDEILLRTRAGRWGQADELMGCGVFSAAGIPLVTGASVASMVATPSSGRPAT
jgi:2-dehydro-3-deoxy-D-gluconate 5-dehydrogenase